MNANVKMNDDGGLMITAINDDDAETETIDESYEVTEQELADIGGFLRTVWALGYGTDDDADDSGFFYGLSSRLTLSGYQNLGLALHLERVMGGKLAIAKAELSEQIAHCYPSESNHG